MTVINLKALDRDIFIRGDDAAARTITLGRTDTFNDIVIIDSATWSVSAAGGPTFAANITANGGITAPKGSNGERYGVNALGSVTSGAGNTAIGNAAGNAVTSGSNNTLLGQRSGEGIVTSSNSVAVGNFALQSSDGGTQVAVGYSSLRHSAGANNLGIGYQALAGSAVTPHTGEFNIAIGANALLVIQGNTWNNTAIGGNSLTALTTGVGNTCIGKDTGKAISTGGSNVLIGNATGDAITTGASNILIGSGLDTATISTTGELRIHYAGGANVPIISGDMVSGILGINTLTERSGTLNIETDNADAIDCLNLKQNDVSENFIEFQSTSDASSANPLSSFTAGNTIQGFLRVDINGTKRWIPFYDAPTS